MCIPRVVLSSVAACLAVCLATGDVQGQSRTASAAPASKEILTGRVLDDATGRGIAGAIVRLMTADGVRETVRTDATGRWRAHAVATRQGDSARLQVRAIGYLAREMPLRAPADAIDGRAAPDGADQVTRLTAAILSLDQMVITAARRAQRLQDVVIATEVVSRADIERTGASDVASLLTEHTGIELQGGHPAGAGVMLQGFGTERVLILVDGQPVAGRISGNLDISRIPLSMVERIEVVKGAQSTLYGSEAMGGVVNIITRAPASDVTGASMSLTAGSQGRRDGTVSVGFGRGRFASTVDVSRRHQQTAPGVGEQTSDGALATRFDVAGRARWTADSSRVFEASVIALDERQRWRSGSFYNFGDNTQLSARLAATFTNGAHRFTPTLSSSHFDHLSRASTASLPIAGDEGQRQVQQVHQAELLYNGRLGPRLAVDAGTQVRVDAIETERVPGGRRTLTSVEPFAQIDYSPTAAVNLVPGVRVAHSTEWGTHVTPRIAARAQLGERLTLRASVGDGYRAPDFKELYMFFQNTSADYAVVGNPDLRPETSRSVMLGAELATNSGYVRAQLFHNAFRDFIETRAITQPGESPVYEYGNIDNGSTRGLELEAGANLLGTGALRLEGGYSLLVTRDDATGHELLGRPSNSARATVSAALPFAFRGAATALFTGRTPMQRDASTGEITAWRDSYPRFDLRLSRALDVSPALSDLEFVIGVDNVLDRQPAEWAGFTGRHVYTALSWSFSRASR